MLEVGGVMLECVDVKINLTNDILKVGRTYVSFNSAKLAFYLIALGQKPKANLQLLDIVVSSQ
jgi:hypothetical protein